MPIHLNALRAYKASARYQRFSAAAKELHVTPVAVGRRVRGLEEWLGVALFVRVSTGRSRLVATESAQRASRPIYAPPALM